MPNFQVLSVRELVERNTVDLLAIAFHEKGRIQDYMDQLDKTECPPILVERDLKIIEGRHRVLSYYFKYRGTIVGERL